MENATKALLMAAGIAMTILLLSFIVALYNGLKSSTEGIVDKIEQNQLNKFNSQFTSYNERNDLTIYDIITVTNLAKQNNAKYDGLTKDNANEGNYYITVSLDRTAKGVDPKYNHLEALNESESIENNSGVMAGEFDYFGNLQTYRCKVIISSITGRVMEVQFKRN